MTTYNSEIKNRTRELFGEFIQKNILKYTPARKVNVLCFPGAEGRDIALELDIYHKLGIPARNIVGLELDEQKYQILLNANLGIELYNMSDLQYLESKPGRKFDCVSLDWMGPLTADKAYVIQRLASDQVLEEHSVLLTNILGKRESRKTQKYFKENFDNITGLLPEQSSSIQEVTSFRDDFMSVLVPYLMTKGKFNLNPLSYEKAMLEYVSQFFAPYEKELDTYLGKNAQEMILTNASLRSKLIENLESKISASDQLDELFLLGKGYHKVDHQRFRYQGNYNSPMLLDFFAFDKSRKEIAKLRKEERRAKVDDTSPFKFIMKKFVHEKLKSSVSDIPNREELDKKQKKVVRSKRKTKKITSEKIGVEQTKELLEKGLSPREIKEQYDTDLTLKQIGAHKAWITMKKKK